MRHADPIDEEQQLPETKLIESSFLFNNRMKIIIWGVGAYSYYFCFFLFYRPSGLVGNLHTC